MGPLSWILAGLVALTAAAERPVGVWHGAYAGDWPAGDPLRPVRAFEAQTGKGLAIVHGFVAVADGFPREACEAINRHGSLPMVSVSPGRWSLEAIARGDADADLRRFSKQAAAWGKPFLLRWAWEMNGKTIPWSGMRNGGPGLGPARYVAVWRRFHRIGAETGMRQARWVWCVDAWGMGPAAGWNHWSAYWPGEGVVDWLGIDAYRWPRTPEHPFMELIDGPLAGDFLSAAPAQYHKPVMVGEWASSNRDGGSAPWIRAALGALGRHPAIGAICWFNKNQDGVDWALQPGTAATAAYRDSVAGSRFTSRFAVAGR
jgi:hypothetical protein